MYRTVDSMHGACCYSTGRYKKHRFFSCAEELGDVGTLLLICSVSEILRSQIELIGWMGDWLVVSLVSRPNAFSSNDISETVA